MAAGGKRAAALTKCNEWVGNEWVGKASCCPGCALNQVSDSAHSLVLLNAILSELALENAGYHRRNSNKQRAEVCRLDKEACSARQEAQIPG